MFDSAPIRTRDELVAHVADMVGVAIRRQTWLLFFDEDDRALPVVVPIDGMPLFPEPEDVEVFADRLRILVDEVGAATVALTWERPGPSTLRRQDVAWVSGIEASDAPVRAQLLSSDEGVRVLDAELDVLVA